MNRSHAFFLLIVLLGVLALSPGCPSQPGDDDDATGDDDDATGDDDDAAGPCDDITDITDSLDGTSVTGATSPSGENLLAPSDECADPAEATGAPEVVYSITAPTDGTMSASTSNPLTELDTVLYVLDACDDSASEIACNDDLEQGNTSSEVTWDATAGVTYYIVVDGYDSTGSFELSVDLAVCGDGVVNGSEQCDDANQNDGDGCAADCTWECVDDSNEDDDTQDDATSLAGETFPVTYPDQVLCPSDLNEEFGVYVDFWAVDVADGEYLAAETGGGGSLTTTCAEQMLSLIILDGDLNGLAGTDTTEGECATAVIEPEAGTYYIAVLWDDQSVAPQDYSLSVDLGVSVCGDGDQEGIEACDDGNLVGGDGCSPSCVEEDAVCTVAAPVEGNIDSTSVIGSTETGTDDHTPVACGFPDGAAEDVYSLTLTEDTTVIVTTNNAGTDYDTTLYVREACTDPGSEVACNDDVGGEILSSALFFEALKDTTYYIFVDGYGDTVGAYELSLTAPVCGDGTVDINEDCDDTNTTPGDGCENDCTETPVCDLTADDDLGVLASGDNTHSVTLLPGADSLSDLACSAPGGGDHLIRFELATAGDVTIAYTQTGDAQIGLFTADADCTAATCEDPVGAEEGTFTVTGAAAGVHYLLIEAWEDGNEGDIALTITAP